MADKPFDRVPLYPLEQPLADDINLGFSEVFRTIQEVAEQLLVPRASISSPLSGSPNSGFLGAGFLVQQTTGLEMKVKVGKGLGFLLDDTDVNSALNGIVGVNDLAHYKPAYLSADETISISAAPGGGNNRIDIIEVKMSRFFTDPSSRQVLDTGTGNFGAQSENKTLSFLYDGKQGTVTNPANSTTAIGYKVGTAAAAGAEAAPATTAGYIKIAEILVVGGATAITTNKIKDLRKMLFPGGVGRVSGLCSVQAGTGSAPVLYGLEAPPGVRVAIVTGLDTRGTTSIYVFPGASPGSNFAAALVTVQQASSSSQFVIVQRGAMVINTVLSGLQTDLANAAKTDPVLDVAVGQPYIQIPFGLVKQASGVTSDPSVGTFTADFTVMWSY